MDFLNILMQQLPADYNYEIYEELTFEHSKTEDIVVTKMQQGNQYQRGVIKPLSIQIASNNPKQMMQVWSQWVKDTSDKEYQEGTTMYYTMFQTPVISQVFIEEFNSYKTYLTIFGTIVETDNVQSIKKLVVNGTEIIPNEAVVSFTNTMHSETLDGGINKSIVVNSVLSLQITTFVEDNNFVNNLKNVRNGLVTANKDYEVELFWNNDELTASETHLFKVSSHSIVKSRGAMDTLTINFVK